MSASPFAAFVSSVEGYAVARYGSASHGRHGELIGATRDPVDPTKITWDTSAIVPLTHKEWAQYRREYEREIRIGALRRRTRDEYESQRTGSNAVETE